MTAPGSATRPSNSPAVVPSNVPKRPNFWDPTGVKSLYDHSEWSVMDKIKGVAAGVGFVLTKTFANMEGREAFVRNIYNTFESIRAYAPTLFPVKGARLLTSFGAVDELIGFMWGVFMVPYFGKVYKDVKILDAEADQLISEIKSGLQKKNSSLTDEEAQAEAVKEFKKSWTKYTAEQVGYTGGVGKTEDDYDRKIKPYWFKLGLDGVKVRILKDGSVFIDRSRLGMTRFQYEWKHKPWQAAGMLGFSLVTVRSTINFLMSFGLVSLPAKMAQNPLFAKVLKPVSKTWEWAGPALLTFSYGAFTIGNGYRILTSNQDRTRELLVNECAKFTSNLSLTIFHSLRFFGIRSPKVAKSALVVGAIAGALSLFSFLYKEFRKAYKERVDSYNLKNNSLSVTPTPTGTPGAPRD